MKKSLIAIIIIIAVLIAGGLILANRGNNEPEAPAAPAGNNTGSTDTSTPPPDDTDNNTDEPAATTESVTIANFAYNPADITVKKGTTVTWTNRDTVGHTVTSEDGGPLDSALLGRGETYSFTFDQTGTFNYFCTPHPHMKGRVTVTES